LVISVSFLDMSGVVIAFGVLLGLHTASLLLMQGILLQFFDVQRKYRCMICALLHRMVCPLSAPCTLPSGELEKHWGNRTALVWIYILTTIAITVGTTALFMNAFFSSLT
jgi:hypothetical protein